MLMCIFCGIKLLKAVHSPLNLLAMSSYYLYGLIFIAILIILNGLVTVNQGYIYVVYEVDKQPELKLKNIFRHNIDVAVPDSGIVLTASPSPDGFMVKLAVADSTKKEVKVMLPGYGIVYAMDTIQCGDKQYRADVFYKGLRGRQPVSDGSHQLPVHRCRAAGSPDRWTQRIHYQIPRRDQYPLL